MNLKQYYQTAKFNLPEHSKWRYFKFHLKKDKWKILIIRNENQLRKLALKYLPLEIFYSQSLFLNPRKIEHPSYMTADQLFINNPQLYFDLDNNDFKKACEDSIELIKIMNKNKDYKLKKLEFTGNKGIRVIYDDKFKSSERDPIKRMMNLYEKRFDLICNLNIESLDYRMTIDPYRVFRLDGSLHGESLMICSEISERVLHSPESILTNAMTKLDAKSIYNPIHITSEDERAGISSSYKFIDSMIYGCKNLYIPYIVIDKKRFRKNKIIKAQKIYKLPEIYVFKTKNNIEFMALKPVDYRRYEKILRFFRAKNLRTFQYYQHQWIRVSSIIDENKNVIEEEPQFKYIVDSDYASKIISKPHKLFLEAKGIPVTGFNTCGTENKVKIAIRCNI